MTEKIEIQCPFCHTIFPRSKDKQRLRPIVFCAYCGTQFHTPPSKAKHFPSYIQEHLPESPPLAQIDRYQLLSSIGKGGMGEVFLAYDTVAGRRVALKRIRPDLKISPTLRRRFIREARITSQLVHPAIIPIYDIHIEHNLIYYTMPHVEGETLRHLMKRVKLLEERDPSLHHSCCTHHTSLQSLIRLFLGITQAIAFAHSRGVLHRDIKPENVIVGKYGEVIILDWGLTKLLEETNAQEDEEEPVGHSKKKGSRNQLTRIGKIVGTLAYMAPERGRGEPASVQTDLYALGIILYQMITLTLPFQRKSIAEFQEKWNEERYIPPEVRAPQRDVPQSLSEIVKKCLAKDPAHRFKTADELIEHIEGYLEGRSEWTESTPLSLAQKRHWSCEEHVLLTEHSAISTPIDHAQWFRVLISRERFSDNVQISATVTLQTKDPGVGFLVGIPEEKMRRHLLDGYCIWLAASETHLSSPSKILRHGISIVELSDVALQPGISHDIRIERIDRTLSVWVDGACVATKTCFLPVTGEYIGILIRNTEHPIKQLAVASGSINILVNRLAVPDAFLAHLDFDQALYEYRKIAALFPGHYEGREALFRSGVCLLEKAKHASTFDMRLYDNVLHEFEKLQSTPGAPLEYLGKSLVYHDLSEYDEEIKCFELVFVRFHSHPLLQFISETLMERMYEMSKVDRKAAYAFISLVLRKLPPETVEKRSTQMLFQALKRSWEVPTLLKTPPTAEEEASKHADFCLTLAFWLQKSYVSHEIFHELIEMPVLPKALLYNSAVVHYLSSPEDFNRLLLQWKERLSDDERKEFYNFFTLFEFLLDREAVQTIPHLPDTLRNLRDPHMSAFLMDRLNSTGRYDLTLEAPRDDITQEYIFESLFRSGASASAEELFALLPQNLWKKEESRLFFWYGALLAARGEVQEMELHFSSVLDTPTPRSWLIGAHVLARKIPLNHSKSGWLSRSFPYEREVLGRQLQAIAPHLPPSSEEFIRKSLEMLAS